MHQLEKIKRQVDKTHPRLGGLVAVAVLSAKARKTLLIVAPAGCGKSVTGQVLKANNPNVRIWDSITRNGLKNLQDEFTGFEGIDIIDDLGKVDNAYSRIGTITTFCELVYSGFVSKHSDRTDIVVTDYKGSATINCQPTVLRAAIKSPEWEATIQDKTIRYYHFFRPTVPTREIPNVGIDWGESVSDIGDCRFSNPMVQRLLRLAAIQWSVARAREHVNDLLKAAAALDGRKRINEIDARVVLSLLRPMAVEHLLMTKQTFEEGRDFNSNLLCLLIEFATYGAFTLEQIARDYRMSPNVALGIMAKLQKYWHSAANSEEKYYPVDSLAKALDSLGATPAQKKVKRGGKARAISA